MVASSEEVGLWDALWGLLPATVQQLSWAGTAVQSRWGPVRCSGHVWCWPMLLQGQVRHTMVVASHAALYQSLGRMLRLL